MYCKKPAPFIILMGNTLIVLVVFMVIDFLYFGVIKPGQDPYTQDIVQKIIYSLFFSLVFAYLYNKASRMWRPNTDEAFFYDGRVVADADLCKNSSTKMLNGIVFSLLVCTVVILAMMLSTFIFTNLYIYLLHGIRGDISQVTGGTEGACVLAGKMAFSAMALESTGRTEDDPDR